MGMTANKDILTSRQLLVLLLVVILNMDNFTVPRRVAQLAGRDGWLSLILAGIWVIVVAVAVVYVASMFPDRSPNEWIPQLFGNWGGKLFIVVYILYFLLLSAWILRIFSAVMRVYLLPRTPSEVIVIALLFSMLYLIGHGINPMARVTQIFFLFTVIPSILLMAGFKNNVQFGELLPVMADGFLPVAQGILPALTAYAGWGIAIYLVQFMDTPKEAMRAMAIAVAALGLIFTWTFVATITNFGPVEVQYLLYPVVELVREMEGIRGFIEKLDLLFLSAWIIGVFVAVAFTYYISILAACQLIGFRDRHPLAFCGLPVVYFLVLLPSGYLAAEKFGNWVGYAGLFIDVCVILMVFMLWYKMRRGGLSTNAE